MPILDLDINGCIKEGPWATKTNTLAKLNPNHPTNKSTIQVQVVVTNVLSYDVLVWGVMLYPMGFVLNFWEETTSHRLGWQLGDGHHAQLQAQYFARGVGYAGGVTILFGFASMLPWGMGLLEGNLDVNGVPPPLKDMTRNIRFG
jgi:hypothetical protein